MFSIAAALPRGFVSTPQGHFTGRFGVPTVVPLCSQVWSPLREHRVAGPFQGTYRTARIAVTPALAGCLIGGMARQTDPQILDAAVPGGLRCGGIVWVPFLRQPGVCRHRPTRAECGSLAGAVGALGPDFRLSDEVMGLRLPHVLPATAVDAPWASQPDLLAALVGEVCRLLALIEGGVPHVLDVLVVRMRQQLPALVMGACTQNLPFLTA